MKKTIAFIHRLYGECRVNHYDRSPENTEWLAQYMYDREALLWLDAPR